MNENQWWPFIAGLAGGLCLGIVIGAIGIDRVWLRFMRATGRMRAPSDEPVGAAPAKASVNSEFTAQRAITAESIEMGADDIIERYRHQGLSISRAEARAQAKAMLSAENPLGGVS